MFSYSFLSFPCNTSCSNPQNALFCEKNSNFFSFPLFPTLPSIWGRRDHTGGNIVWQLQTADNFHFMQKSDIIAFPAEYLCCAEKSLQPYIMFQNGWGLDLKTQQYISHSQFHSQGIKTFHKYAFCFPRHLHHHRQFPLFPPEMYFAGNLIFSL